MALDKLKPLTQGAFGAGLVLVVLPSVGLFLGVDWIDQHPAVGLPLMAIFGILILFGAMALTSTLFRRLGLSDRSEPLALPPGSVRAAIALALVVLFAIISIMLFQVLSQPYVIRGVAAQAKDELLKQPANRVIAVVSMACAASGVEGGCFDVHVARPHGEESTDIAKQLLVLIGTLMTSLVSYYFAARTAAQAPSASDRAAAMPAPQAPAPPVPIAAAAIPATHSAATRAHAGDDEDGCDVPIADATPDEQLPPAKGGVA
jgi:hypothetical protein